MIHFRFDNSLILEELSKKVDGNKIEITVFSKGSNISNKIGMSQYRMNSNGVVDNGSKISRRRY